MTEHVFDFAVVEDLVMVRHPDPDGHRQELAVAQGVRVSAPWLGIVLGVDRRKIAVWRERGVRFYEADEIAVTLGQHPSAVWPEWATVADDEDDDGEDPGDWFRQRRADAYQESVNLRLVAS